MRFFLSVFLSYLLGHFFLKLIFNKNSRPNDYLHFFLALGTGIVLSTQILFYGFVIFDRLNRPVMIASHFIFLFGLLILNFKKHKQSLFNFRIASNPSANLCLIIIVVMFVPTICRAYFFPMGGWDAWSAWNLKARFLFLGKENWRNLLDPVLWRSSPHYPLLLPLMNVWGWIFYKTTEPLIPLLTSLMFSLMTAGLLFAGLMKNPLLPDLQTSKKKNWLIRFIPLLSTCRRWNFRIKPKLPKDRALRGVKRISLKKKSSLPPTSQKSDDHSPLSLNSPMLLALLGVLLMISLPFFTKLASSQYCDIVLAYYLLGTLVCLIFARSKNLTAFSFLAGLFLGSLSFTKTEAMSACLIIFLLSLPYLFLRGNALKNQSLLIFFFFGLCAGIVPTILFEKLYSPSNQTFINGLASTVKPANLFRIKMILSFLAIELVSVKWNGLWLILLAGIILSRGNAFHPTIRIVPIFLFLYLIVVGFYYYLNTYFDIGWWLSVSLNRILFGILPTVVFWVFYSLIHRDETGDV